MSKVALFAHIAFPPECVAEYVRGLPSNTVLCHQSPSRNAPLQAAISAGAERDKPLRSIISNHWEDVLDTCDRVVLFWPIERWTPVECARIGARAELLNKPLVRITGWEGL